MREAGIERAQSVCCAAWWSDGWQRLMDTAAREYDERALPYRGRTDYIYERTMRAHQRDGRSTPCDCHI